MERQVDINSINKRALQFIRELSISIAEISYSIKEHSNWIRELSNSSLFELQGSWIQLQSSLYVYNWRYLQFNQGAL